MPQTKIQKFVFSILMSFVMVYGMEVYNRALLHGGLTNELFLLSPAELIVLMLLVIVLQTFIGGPLARRLAFRMVDPETDRELFVTLAIQAMTICLMCPLMSLAATIAFKGGFSPAFAATWIQTVAVNFPMALCWQVFVAGPLVRFIVRTAFKPNEEEAAA